MTLFERTVEQRLTGERVLWLGAISFEERCVGSVETLARLNIDIASAVLLNYPTTIATPRSEDERRRRHYRKRLTTQLGAATAMQIIDVDPYVPLAAYRTLEQELRSYPDSILVTDVTCMTRAHALGLAAVLANNNTILARTIFSYTSPRRYGPLRAASPDGWRETMVLPLVQGARLGNAGHARGLVVLGHEADRLAVAISEFEPEGGSLIFVDSPSRPDFGRTTRSNNRTLLEYWRLVGGDSWREVVLTVEGAASIASFVEREAELAAERNAPVVLYPYGPKITCLAAGLFLARVYPDRAWFAYPVPRSYDIDHTFGVGRTVWFDGDWLPLGWVS
jgi:hypothetical protein